jgi:2-amino-4-hydroxy-6-hydroxymethyldihydropteridine diphosphokinase
VSEASVAYIALGTNVGDRDQVLRSARAALASLAGTRVLAESSIEETRPLSQMDQANYLNQMVALETTLEPETLLDELLRIEKEHGRARRERWGPRTLDLDIVRFGERVVSSERLTVPHPEIPNRDFWQRELIELRGDWR